MAITVTPLIAGASARKWQVDFALDADTSTAIAHGLPDTPEFVHIVPRGPDQATITANKAALPGVGAVDATNINVLKSTAVGSGGSSVFVIAALPVVVV